jgi:hypothetical protein
MAKFKNGLESHGATDGEREIEEKKAAERERLAVILKALRAIQEALKGVSKRWRLCAENPESSLYSWSGLMNKLGIGWGADDRTLNFRQTYEFLKKEGLCKEVSGVNPFDPGKTRMFYVLCLAELNQRMDDLIKKLNEELSILGTDKNSGKVPAIPKKTVAKQKRTPFFVPYRKTA